MFLQTMCFSNKRQGLLDIVYLYNRVTFSCDRIHEYFPNANHIAILGRLQKNDVDFLKNNVDDLMYYCKMSIFHIKIKKERQFFNYLSFTYNMHEIIFYSKAPIRNIFTSLSERKRHCPLFKFFFVNPTKYTLSKRTTR